MKFRGPKAARSLRAQAWESMNSRTVVRNRGESRSGPKVERVDLCRAEAAGPACWDFAFYEKEGDDDPIAVIRYGQVGPVPKAEVLIETREFIPIE